jgi:FkbM family methyltransferase
MRLSNYLNHTILIEPLRERPPVVVDCGANHGEFAAWVRREFDARVYGYEPDPRLFAQLAAAQTDEVMFIPKAIAAHEGTAQLNLGVSQCSSIHYVDAQSDAAAETVQTVTLAGEFARLGLEWVDLVKLDIEGAEIEVLRTLPVDVLLRIGQITTEFHDFMRHEDTPAIREVIDRLRSLGFYALRFSTRTYGDVLFVNQARIPLARWQRLALLGRGKLLPGMRRTLARRIG